MNYLKQLNGFWAKCENVEVSVSEIAVYMALLNYNNKLSWKSPFVCHHYFVCQLAKVSKNTYYNTMDKLHEKEFIVFNKGIRNGKSPKVSIRNLENKSGIICIQNDEQDEELSNEQKENLYKQLNNKTIKLLNNNPELINSNIEHWVNNCSSENKKYTNKKSIDKLELNYKEAANVDPNPILYYKNELLKDENFIMHICAKESLTINIFHILLDKFTQDQQATQKFYSKYPEFSTHFMNWIAKNKMKYSVQTHIKSNRKLLGEN